MRHQHVQICLAIALAIATGCTGMAASPTAPSMTPAQSSAAAPTEHVSMPWPHFTLQVQPASSGPTLVGEAWRGLVMVTPILAIVRPELPVRVVTMCGEYRRTYEGMRSGEVFFSCDLPVGEHRVLAQAETADGRTVTASVVAIISYPKPIVVPIYYTVPFSSRTWTDVGFSVRTFEEADRHQWDFGDGVIGTTRLPFVDHRYIVPATGNTERVATVSITAADGRLIATGRVVGIW